MTLIRVTKTQQDAVRYYAQDGLRSGKAPAVSTQRALLAKRLIRERQATDEEKRAIGRPVDQPWRITELTGDGLLLMGQITEAPADGPKDPHAVDPFAAFD